MLEFIDCPSCGKRIRQNADRCHRCGATFRDEEIGEIENATGGYSEDDFDYDAFVEREFEGKSSLPRIWHYTAWVLVILFIIPIAYAILYLIGFEIKALLEE